VGAWGAAPGYAGPGFARQTLRLVVTPHAGGSVVRLRFTNRYSPTAVRLDRVAVGLSRSRAALVAGTNRRVTFRSRRSVSIGPGGAVISDPVRLRFRAFQDLAVSVHLDAGTASATAHPLSHQASYLAQGDHATDPSGRAFAGGVLGSWPLLAGLDVLAPRRRGAVVAFGDSITDGFPGGGGPNRRYPDFLARRLLRAGSPLSVLNAGISGNRILEDAPPDLPIYGPSALSRLGRDVPGRAAVSDAILLEGINDIGRSGASAPQVIGGLRRMVDRLRRRGLNVLLGTITPSGGSTQGEYGSAAANAARLAVNRWIRRGRPADRVVDFDAVLRDAADPGRLAPRYDSGDHLHPNGAGYRRMAAAVPIRDLRGSSCQPR
jgi:lysophospholipase L1-like esterase